MCGRFTTLYEWLELQGLLGTLLGWSDPGDLDLARARFNVAPTQVVPVVRRVDGRVEVGGARWGFARPRASGVVINARVETAHQRVMFRDSLMHRRCLVPASGFYEWERSGGRSKRAWYLRKRGGGVFFFAGLWREGSDGGAEFVVLTGEPVDELTRRVHDRAPMVVAGADVARWLDSEITRAGPAESLAVAFGEPRAFGVEGWRVGRGVNSVVNEGSGLIERVEGVGGEGGDVGEGTLFG